MNKTIIKTFRFSQDDIKRLEKKSKDLNLSKADTIRYLIENATIQEAPPTEFYDLLKKINNIGDKINAIIKNSNSLDENILYSIKACFTTIDLLINEIKRKFLEQDD